MLFPGQSDCTWSESASCEEPSPGWVDSSYRCSNRITALGRAWPHLYSKVVVIAFRNCSDPEMRPLRSQ